MLKFTPGMFNKVVGYPTEAANKLAAELCQEHFDKWLSEQPMVYGCDVVGSQWSKGQFSIDTHQARLVCIEEIKPKECEHKPLVNYDPGRFGLIIEYRSDMKCHQCGKRIKVTFEECE